MTILAGLILGLFLFYFVDKIFLRVKFLKKRFWDNPITFFGYHVHHSFYGLILLVVGIARFPFLIGFGIGMIISHTIIDKHLIFIEKVKRKK